MDEGAADTADGYDATGTVAADADPVVAKPRHSTKVSEPTAALARSPKTSLAMSILRRLRGELSG
jgi:hypothetical protein